MEPGFGSKVKAGERREKKKKNPKRRKQRRGQRGEKEEKRDRHRQAHTNCEVKRQGKKMLTNREKGVGKSSYYLPK